MQIYLCSFCGEISLCAVVRLVIPLYVVLQNGWVGKRVFLHMKLGVSEFYSNWLILGPLLLNLYILLVVNRLFSTWPVGCFNV